MVAPHTDIDKWIKENLFNTIPMSIAVIDQEFNLVYANSAFEQMFGTWQNRKCFSVYKSRDSICPYCKGGESFKDGVSRIHREVGYNKNGLLTLYIKHTIPIKDEDGNIPFLIEISADITETEQIRKEYQLLFNQVPCNILLIDRNFRIVKTNEKLKQMFGDLEGMYCFEALKGLNHKCSECTARQTFEDGQMHAGHHMWKTKEGETVHSHVITVPLELVDGSFDLVMEMTVDITQTMKLEDEIKVAHAFMEAVIATSMDGIIAVNNSGIVTIFNRSARGIFNIADNHRVTKKELISMLPEGFLDQVSTDSGHLYLPETDVKTIEGDKVPVRLAGTRLSVEDRLGMAFLVQDLREIKKLEKEKLEAERLAAVGQTVAGLAHGVKNLITALEGGMYMLNTGMSKSNIDRIQKGMEMLVRNIDRISIFIKAFLDFSKGREIQVKRNNPTEIAQEVVDLYSARAKELGIKLKYERIGDIKPAAIDYESMHECLTNLVGNAIDACRVSEDQGGRQVNVRTFEEDGVIIYEVVDNGCGMDYEVKKKVFTTFFTTKGLGGSGIGLLMTKKIIQEHGGSIDLESEPGQGTTFRIRLPRHRLPKTIEN